VCTRMRELIVLFAAGVFVVSALIYKGPLAQVKVKNDQELFLAGASAIGEGKYPEGRVLLRTLIYTYPDDSNLTEEAKVLVFYSYAREGGQKNEEGQVLLQRIEDFLKAREAKPRVQ
jgi:hypothetical protein